MINESEYQRLADIALRNIEDMLADVDADDVDVERSGDVLTLTFASGQKAVINTQRPTRQIWVAANARAWHFRVEAAPAELGTEATFARARWVDEKDERTELVSHVALLVETLAGRPLALRATTAPTA